MEMESDSLATTFTSIHTPSLDQADSFPIPNGTQIGLEYLAEGAAHVVYKVHKIVSSQNKTTNGKHVLRLNKKNLSDATKQAIHDFHTHIVPMFDRSMLLEHILFQVPATLSTALNESLVRQERQGLRPEKRCGTFFPSFQDTIELYGVLMPDLSFQEPGQQLVEFKAKWLLQSPSAPKHARRCRTCALKDMRKATGMTPGRGDSGFCPFDLLSSDNDILTSALAHIWPSDHYSLVVFVAAFRSQIQPALRHLQRLQREHNHVALPDFETVTEELPVAMALRDCSILMQVSRVSKDESGKIESFKFADLDLKKADGGKLDYWAEIERKLIEEGWYTGGTISSRGTSCALGRLEFRHGGI